MPHWCLKNCVFAYDCQAEAFWIVHRGQIFGFEVLVHWLPRAFFASEGPFGFAQGRSAPHKYSGLLSPTDTFVSRHQIEMAIAAQERKRMLPAKGCNPN